MSELTREKIEQIQHYGTHIIDYDERPAAVIALCVMALKYLDSQSAVRPEVDASEPVGYVEKAMVAWLKTEAPHNGVVSLYKECENTDMVPVYLSAVSPLDATACQDCGRVKPQVCVREQCPLR